MSSPKSQSQYLTLTTLNISGVCCSSEVPLVLSTLSSHPSVSSISISIPNKTASFLHDKNLCRSEVLRDALVREGFGSSIKSYDTVRVTENEDVKIDDNDTSGVKVNDDFSSYTCHSPPLFLKKSFSFEPRDVPRITAAIPSPQRPPPNSNLLKTTLLVTGICCSSEIKPIKKILHSLIGVKNVSINVTSKLVYIEYDNSLNVERILKVMEEEGFKASLRRTKGEEKGMRPKCSVLLCGFLWIVSLFAPMLPTPYDELEELAGVAFLVGIYPILGKTWESVKRFSIDANLLMSVAAIGAMSLHQFSEAAGLTFLFSLGEWLESQATHKAKVALESIVNLMPETANKQTISSDNQIDYITVPAESVNVNDIVLVKPGSKIPVDGLILKGTSIINESNLTGESKPVSKTINSPVFSGTINIGSSPIIIKTSKTTKNSTVAKLISLVEEAQSNRSPTEKLIDEFAKCYTPTVLITSLLMCTLPFLIYGKETGLDWFYRGIVLIIIACPCALIISTPVAYVAGLGATAKKGIIVKGGIHLEALSAVKTIACDKTGTLTHGEFNLLELYCAVGKLKGYTRLEIFRLLAIMEAESSHPMAVSLVKAAKNEGVELTSEDIATSHTILKGEGVEGEIDGETVYVGNLKLIERLGMLPSVGDIALNKAAKWSSNGGTVGFVAIENVGVLCVFVVADKVRNESKIAVRQLQNMGIEVFMLTGDGKGAADAIAKQVGIKPENVKSQLLPIDKLNFIKTMKLKPANEETPLMTNRSTRSEHYSSDVEGSNKVGLFSKRDKVMMCGDGVNDAPALACADVGVAMGTGAAIAMETADVALINNNIQNIVYCVSMGRKVVTVIKQNLVFSLVVKAVVICLVMAGYGNLWVAIISDVGAMLCVTLNGMRLLPNKKQ